MENLYPNEELTIESTDLIDEDSPVGYLGSVYFDESIGDFSRDGQFRLKPATGLEAWEQWCINCISTERGVYPAYGDLFGISTYEAFKAETRAEIESILTLEITEGLKNDPYQRTEYVENITFNWLPSEDVEVTITVRGIEEVTIDITVVINPKVR